MAEIEQNIDPGTQVQDQSIAPVKSESVAPEGQQTAPVEKMIPQSQVSKIAAREAREAAAKATAEAKAQFDAERAQFMQSQQQQQPNSVGGMQQQSPDEIRKMIHEEAQKMAQSTHIRQIEDNWNGAMKAEMHADPEFADLYDALNIEEQPMLIVAMSGMDNKAAIVKELANNPSKYAQILMLANGGSPKLAMKALNEVSASIKTNEAAKKQPKVDAPLSQIKPSNISTDNGEMSVSDYRKQAWLRG